MSMSRVEWNGRMPVIATCGGISISCKKTSTLGHDAARELEKVA